jgi:hypothetical protein
MDIKQNSLLKPSLITPVGLSLSVLIWTFVISPYTKYGDNWAVYPVLVAALVILGWHIFLIVKPSPLSRTTTISYGLLHMAIFSYIFMLSLMLISKDSL